MDYFASIVLLVSAAAIHAQLIPGPACPPTISRPAMTEDIKRLIIDTHNQLRSQVARGLETRGRTGPQPSASNMRALVWDNVLEGQAAENVHQCVMRHDNVGRTYRGMPVGQNLAWQFFSDIDGAVDWEGRISQWYDEVANYFRRPDNIFPSEPPASQALEFRHYTQVVWADTDRVGCSILRTESGDGQLFNYFYACNYSPAGNFMGRPVYRVGRPASACPAGTTADFQTGLCR